MDVANFETGKRQLQLNGGCIIEYNPGSRKLAKKLLDMFEHISDGYEKYERESKDADSRKVFDLLDDLETLVRNEVDKVFGQGKSMELFPEDPLEMVDGLPEWANFYFTIVDKLDDEIKLQQSRMNPRMDAYLQKYSKYGKKK